MRALIWTAAVLTDALMLAFAVSSILSGDWVISVVIVPICLFFGAGFTYIYRELLQSWPKC